MDLPGEVEAGRRLTNAMYFAVGAVFFLFNDGHVCERDEKRLRSCDRSRPSQCFRESEESPRLGNTGYQYRGVSFSNCELLKGGTGKTRHAIGFILCPSSNLALMAVDE